MDTLEQYEEFITKMIDMKMYLPSYFPYALNENIGGDAQPYDGFVVMCYSDKVTIKNPDSTAYTYLYKDYSPNGNEFDTYNAKFNELMGYRSQIEVLKEKYPNDLDFEKRLFWVPLALADSPCFATRSLDTEEDYEMSKNEEQEAINLYNEMKDLPLDKFDDYLAKRKEALEDMIKQSQF